MLEVWTLPRKRDNRVAALMAENRKCGLDIDARTGVSNWQDGEYETQPAGSFPVG